MEQEIHDVDEKKFSLRLEARLKNAALVNAREKLDLTAKGVAELIGVSYSSYVQFETMGKYPGPKTRAKVCNFYGLLEENVFPQELRRVKSKKIVLEREIPRSNLISLAAASHKHLLPPVSIESEIEEGELKEQIERVLGDLKTREAYVIRRYYGLDGGEEETFEEISLKLGVSRSRANQIHDKAMAKIRGYDPWGRKVVGGIGKRLEVYLENLSR